MIEWFRFPTHAQSPETERPSVRTLSVGIEDWIAWTFLAPVAQPGLYLFSGLLRTFGDIATCLAFGTLTPNPQFRGDLRMRQEDRS